MSERERAASGEWQAWLRTCAQRAHVTPRIAIAHGARVADPLRHAWRAHLAGLAAARG